MCITNDQKLSKFLKRTKIFSNDLNLFHRGIFQLITEPEKSEEDLSCEEQFFDDASIGEAVSLETMQKILGKFYRSIVSFSLHVTQAIIQPHISLDHAQLNFGKCPNIPCLEQKVETMKIIKILVYVLISNVFTIS